MLRIVRPTECLGRRGEPCLDKSKLDLPTPVNMKI